MLSRASIPALALIAAVAAAAPPAGEAEPDSFDAPQAIGTLGAGGLSVSGTLDPTSPTGLAPGDMDGFSFATEAAGPIRATLDAPGGGTLFLGLAREDPSGPVFLGAGMGGSPLVLTRPGLAAGATYRIGVAALGDGTPLAYSLSLAVADGLPPWSGEDLPGPVPEAEPDEAAATSTDLGDFTGRITASGSLSAVAPHYADEGYTGDTDIFRFRNVLPTAARLVFRADPGGLRVEVQSLALVGAFPMVEAVFGETGEIALPVLLPGAAYFVQVRGDYGTVPLGYSFFLEPVGGGTGLGGEPLEILRATVRRGPGGPRGSFSVEASFDGSLAGDLPDGAAFSYAVRGAGEEFAEGLLATDDLGRLRYRAVPGDGVLRSFTVDPFRGRIRLRGRGVDWGDAWDPEDPGIPVEVEVGGLLLSGSAEGKGKGGTLKVK